MTAAPLSPAAFLAQCRERGIALTVQDGPDGLGLCVEADSIPPRVLDYLRSHKPELIALLSEMEPDTGDAHEFYQARLLAAGAAARSGTMPPGPMLLANGQIIRCPGRYFLEMWSRGRALREQIGDAWMENEEGAQVARDLEAIADWYTSGCPIFKPPTSENNDGDLL